MRCFIGLALPLEARESLAAALVPLRSTLGRLSWTASENYHLTLAFLGELEAQVEKPETRQWLHDVRAIVTKVADGRIDKRQALEMRK